MFNFQYCSFKNVKLFHFQFYTSLFHPVYIFFFFFSSFHFILFRSYTLQVLFFFHIFLIHNLANTLQITVYTCVYLYLSQWHFFFFSFLKIKFFIMKIIRVLLEYLHNDKSAVKIYFFSSF